MTATDTLADNYVRDYGTSPSINDPQSYDEAMLALIHDFHRSMTDPNHSGRGLDRPFTTDMGFGLIRSERTTQYLEDARQNLLARFGDVLNEINGEIDRDAIRAARA